MGRIGRPRNVRQNGRSAGWATGPPPVAVFDVELRKLHTGGSEVTAMDPEHSSLAPEKFDITQQLNLGRSVD